MTRDSRSLSRTEIATMVEDMAALIGDNLGSDDPIPWAYYSFPKGTLTSTPFLIYYFSDNDDFKADNLNYATIENLIIELYSENVNFGLEDVIQNVMNNHFMNYTKTFSFIESEEMYLTRYESEVLIYNGEQG
jgi:hypothetical protein